MEGSGCTQETIRGTYPTTDTYRVKNAQIEIIHKCRQLIDIDEVGQSSARPNASKLYLSSRSLLNTTGLIIQFLVGIKDNETGELWNCNVKSHRKLVIDNGTFSIEVEFEPNALALFPPTDCKGCQLPQYMGNVKCFLPVESDDPAVYMIRLKLFQHKEREKNLLDYMQFYVRSHEHGHDLFDYQEGRSITEVERPQMKIKMAGILAKDTGRSIAIHFQSLGDNGLHQLFEEDKKKLIQRIDGIAEYQDLNLSVMLEESILQFEQNKTEQCLATAMKVKELALETNSANAPFLIAKAYYIISAIYRQAGDFEKAKECMEISTELLEPVIVCEERAVNQYNWAALLSEKSARASLTPTEKKEAEFHFQNTLSLWEQQDQNNTKRCLMRTQIRNINFNLKTSRQNFPDSRKTTLKVQKHSNFILGSPFCIFKNKQASRCLRKIWKQQLEQRIMSNKISWQTAP